MLTINPKTHKLNDIRFISSPNFNERPQNEQIDLIVIHSISLPPAQFGNNFIEQFFTNQLDLNQHPYFMENLKDLKVSAHVVIDRDGKITQYVPFDKRAWHAGQSSFNGRLNCNDFSIGIELEGFDTVPYTEEQYAALAQLINALMRAYPHMTPERIVGHSDIAPGRKTDPGPFFDWQYFREITFTAEGMSE
jgi:AmpD protein